MNKLILIFSALLVSTLANVAFADADAVYACSRDKYTQKRILEIPAGERVDVLNLQKEVVGAIEFSPDTGSLNNFYLCGANQGSYYMEGNLWDGTVESIYNDEYDSKFDVEVDGSLLTLNIQTIYFAGDVEGADYPPFSAKLFVNIPAH